MSPLPILFSPASGLTAAITDPGNTMKIAPYSEMFSGLDSVAGANEIVRWEWDFDDTGSTDPQFDEGMFVGHKFDSDGTYNVKLTVHDSAGGSNSATKVVTVVPFTGTTYYVKNGGSDAADGLSDGNAWATLPYALANMGGSQGSPNQLLLNRGDQWTPGSSLSAPNPSRLGAYGTGAKPKINFALGQKVGFGVDETVEWGLGPVLDDWHLYGTSGPFLHDELLDGGVLGSTVRGCVLENGAMQFTRNAIDPPDNLALFGSHITIEDTTASNGLAHGIYTQYNQWFSVRRCTFTGNGDDPVLDHQMYFNIVQKVLVEDSTFDGAGANANFGMKQNSVVDGLYRRCEVVNCKNGISNGTNWSDDTDPSNTNVINDGHVVHALGADNQAFGIAMARTVSTTVRNCVFYDFNLSPLWANGGIYFVSAVVGTAPPGQVHKIYNNTFYDLACPDIDIDPDVTQFASIEIKNNIFYRTDAVSSDHTFYEISDAAVVTDVLDADYNCFYHDLVGQSTISIAVGSSTPTHSYDTWRSTYTNQDQNSVWGDPLFVSKGTGDFTLTTPTSPAHDAGVTIESVHEDIDQVDRPVGAAYDMGAHEQ